MSKIVSNMQMVSRRAFRLKLRIHSRDLLAAACGLGLIVLAPAVPAQKLAMPSATPTPISQNTRGAAPTELTVPASKAPQQDPIPAQAPAAIPQEQALATETKVTYEAGQLTIIAENSKLSDVLSSLRACMGTDIDLPASASGERIWARLGPGPARKILATLLSGTKLDYVIQASDTDPDGIRNVWLTRRSEASAVTSARVGTSGGHQLPPRQSDTDRRIVPSSHSAVEDRAPEETVSTEPAVAADLTPATNTQSAQTDAAVAPASAQPSQTDAAVAPTTPQPASAEVAAASDPQGSEANKPPASPTEQMIHTLQNMYEQRKQLQLARTPSASN